MSCYRHYPDFKCNVITGPDGLCKEHHNKHLYYLRTYGITIVQVEAIIKYQKNKCPVCRKILSLRGWTVDHSHKHPPTVRGVLHAFCNQYVVGRHTDWVLLQNAADYLHLPPAWAILGDQPTVPAKKRRKRRNSLA